MRNLSIRKISLSKSEDQSIEDWSNMSSLQLLELGHQLRLQYMYTYNLSDKIDRSKISIKKLGQEE